MTTKPRLATVAELSDWLGEPITEDVDDKRAGAVLDYASMLVRQEVGKTWDGDDEEVPEQAHLVTLQVAARGYTNPESWGNEGTDDWRGGNRPIKELGMYLTATERRMLAELRPPKPQGIGVIATTRMPERDPLHGWVPTDGGPPFPWY